ncbi:hypothetical protein HZS_610 [Henneguya salminicola]|nr:hypothetical protein HZS_610 [Henneguya salminicola]
MPMSKKFVFIFLSVFFVEGFLKEIWSFRYFRRDSLPNDTMDEGTIISMPSPILDYKREIDEKTTNRHQYVKWQQPSDIQIRLLKQVLDKEPTFQYLTNYKVDKVAFEIIDYSIYAVYKLETSEDKDVYVKILFWRPYDTLKNRQPPELIEVTDLNPLKMKKETDNPFDV